MGKRGGRGWPKVRFYLISKEDTATRPSVSDRAVPDDVQPHRKGRQCRCGRPCSALSVKLGGGLSVAC